MRKDEFTMACMGCGLSVSKVGAIKDDEFEYGFIKEKKILTCVGDDVPLDDIVELCYRESEHTLKLTYEKGNVVNIPGAKLSKEDAASLLNQMVMPTCLMELNSVMDKLFPGSRTSCILMSSTSRWPFTLTFWGLNLTLLINL